MTIQEKSLKAKVSRLKTILCGSREIYFDT